MSESASGLPRGAATLSVGIISADLMNLSRDVKCLEAAGVRIAHFDVMDGRFCPMLTVGPWFVGAVETNMVKDVHLMVEDPVGIVDQYVAAGAGLITVHLELGRHVHRALERIGESAAEQNRPVMRGLGVNPGTPVSSIEPHLDVLDVVYVLGINPGWRQPLIPSTFERVRTVQALVASSEREILVAVDGGITLDNYADVAALAPDIVVSGSAVFKGDVAGNLRRFAELQQSASRIAAGVGGPVAR